VAPGPARSAGGPDVGRVEIPLSPGAGRELPRRAARLGVTLNTLVQGAWAMVISRLSGRRDVVLAAVVAGRPASLPGAESIVGTFINTVPVRVRCDPDGSVERMLTDLQKRQLALLGHQHHGLAAIQRAAGLPVLTDSLVAYESFPLDRQGIAEAGEAAGITVTDIDLFTLSTFPVTIFAYPGARHLRLILQYQPDRLSRERANEMAALFGRVLTEISGNA
jgi:non-ribosomal peptide synthetase component F